MIELSISEFLLPPPYFIVILLLVLLLLIRLYKFLLIFFGSSIKISSIEIEKIGKEMLHNKLIAEDKKYSENEINEKINTIINSKEFKEIKTLKELDNFVSKTLL